jgi:hypothetical protein
MKVQIDKSVVAVVVEKFLTRCELWCDRGF